MRISFFLFGPVGASLWSRHNNMAHKKQKQKILYLGPNNAQGNDPLSTIRCYKCGR